MDDRLQRKIEQKYYRNDFDAFEVGDTVKVYTLIREGEKNRVQIFRGVVISKKGSGTRAMFTVRKISDGVGVEKIFPVHSPNVEKIEIVKTGGARRSKLYYLRDRVGKQALKVNPGEDMDARKESLKARKAAKAEIYEQEEQALIKKLGLDQKPEKVESNKESDAVNSEKSDSTPESEKK